jgi:Recombination endonuclease VII
MAKTRTAAQGRRKPTRAKQLGVSDDEYARMLAAQNGGCAICGSPPKTRRLHVDHDHASGKVRGLLCHRCNRALPTWIDEFWLCRAAMYLEPVCAGHTVGWLADQRHGRWIKGKARA